MTTPPFTLCSGHYEARMARTDEELDSALRLRYRVFNLELHEGLAASHRTQRDEDEFDPVCRHLLVVDKRNGETVGTYRMQTREMAEAGSGFYSAGEFDFSALPQEFLEQSVELGRACIAREHRNGRALFLLWRGVVRYAMQMEKRYLFGCCSLTSQDPREGFALMEILKAEGHEHPTLRVLPHPTARCYPPGARFTDVPRIDVPRLMTLYLTYGAKVCGPPALDREFKTIDYLAVFDLGTMETHARKVLTD